jgi:hypothetical protein
MDVFGLGIRKVYLSKKKNKKSLNIFHYIKNENSLQAKISLSHNSYRYFKYLNIFKP